MSARAMIQVPEELKENIEGLKDTFHEKTNYAVIEKLIVSYQNFGEYRKRKDKEEQQLKQNHAEQLSSIVSRTIDVGIEEKDKFEKLKTKLGLKTDRDLLLLLMDHFSSADAMKKGTFNLYLKLREG